MGENLYSPIRADLLEVKDETPTIKTFRIAPDEAVPFRAGQFVQLTVPGLGEAPFTPSSSPSVEDELEITILRTGKVTNALHAMEDGVELGVRGPYGKGYPTEKMKGHNLLVVGGGVGLAPLRSLLHHAFENLDDYPLVAIKYGARNPSELLYQNVFEQWAAQDNVTVDLTVDIPDETWDGNVGVVTTLLEELDLDIAETYVVSCGPLIMLRFVTLTCLNAGFKPEQIYLSMNRKMSCGFGKCGRCNIGPLYLCKDGPDVCYDEIKDYKDAFSF
ncbi:MAG: FAD/NAD(P)-binding protein [Candidatus Brocadiia bacterium]